MYDRICMTMTQPLAVTDLIQDDTFADQNRHRSPASLPRRLAADLAASSRHTQRSGGPERPHRLGPTAVPGSDRGS